MCKLIDAEPGFYSPFLKKNQVPSHSTGANGVLHNFPITRLVFNL